MFVAYSLELIMHNFFSFIFFGFNIKNPHVRSSATLIRHPSLANIPQQFGALKIVTSFLSAKNSYPSSTTKCPLQIRSISFFLQKSSTTFSLNVQLTPRSFSSQSLSLYFGSLHRRSQSKPVSGTSFGLSRDNIYLGTLNSGERPPCMHIILSSIKAEIGS